METETRGHSDLEDSNPEVGQRSQVLLVQFPQSNQSEAKNRMFHLLLAENTRSSSQLSS